MKTNGSNVDQAFNRYQQLSETEKVEFKAMIRGYESKDNSQAPAAPQQRKPRAKKDAPAADAPKGATATA